MTTCDRVSWALALAVFVAAPAARAQAEDQAAARSLFDEGRKLLKAGNYAEACPKLEAAGKLFPSPGILLNLADCYEKENHTASAWTEFGEAAVVADRANRHDQVAEARRRQAAIEPKLMRLAIRVPRGVPGLVVKRDGSVLESAAWGSPIPIDSGSHEVHAEAPGYQAWTGTVSVTTPGQTVAFDVPELIVSPAPAPVPVAKVDQVSPTPSPATSLAESPDQKPRSRTLGFVLLGSGVVVGAGGAVLMGIEAGRASHARSTNTPATTAASASEYDSTKTPYSIGVVGAVAGGIAAAVGLVLVATVHGTSSSSAMRATPWVGSSAGGVLVQGGW